MFRLVLILVLGCCVSKVWGASQNFVGLVDPTMPLQLSLQGVTRDQLGERVTEVVIESKTYQVSSILVRPNGKYALINQQQVQEGDEIEGAVVAKIDRDGVTLQRGIEAIRLSLYKDSTKRPRP
ncbi:MAG: hypothetical protein ACKVKN_15240 [Pseudomonadales bacterium]|tara:strand:- start:106 stop:477 length:372 start_codon:yes stop_codon:yes gene_type:complete